MVKLVGFSSGIGTAVRVDASAPPVLMRKTFESDSDEAPIRRPRRNKEDISSELGSKNGQLQIKAPDQKSSSSAE